MPARIYALAKELDIDSKVLVDLCSKAGVEGKGSALASLTDEEVVIVKDFISKGGQAGGGTAVATPPSAVAAPVVPSAPSGKVPAISSPHRREDYIAPGGGAGGKPHVIPYTSDKGSGEEKEDKKSSGGEGGKPGPRTPSTPSLKLAPIPVGKQAPPPKKPEEPAPQKPEIKLPMDAIRAGKSGKTPLAEHLKKHEEKRRKELADAASGTTSKPEVKKDLHRPKGAPAPAAGGAPPPALPGARGPHRGKGEVRFTDGVDTALGGREMRQLKRKRTDVPAKKPGSEEGETPRFAPVKRFRRLGTNTAAPRKGKVQVELPLTVRSFSEALGISAAKVLGKLMGMEIMTNISASLSRETAELLALEFGVEIEFKEAATMESKMLAMHDEIEDDPSTLKPRPPVVTFLGHVDHGKTSLLDRIIGIDVAGKESGGITQHIRAYRISHNGRDISFVDTPGHEAFTEMRARGANVTDIAVLVVAADDGVMPQTEEAIGHARAANVPIVVALNKIDLPGIDHTRILQQLASQQLLATEWGGDVEVIKCSALKGIGVDDLVETLLTIAELHEYKANYERSASGTCLESEMHEGRGVVAKLLVQKGTLKVGDVVVCGSSYGKVKAMYDTLQPRTKHATATPSTPVNVTGLSEAPAAGEKFYVMPDIAKAREVAQQRAVESRTATLSGGPEHLTLENLFERLGKEQVQTLNIILRADTRGSIEALQKELTKLQHPEVQVKILMATVGGITEADVQLADVSDAIIVGFNVVPDEKARQLADQKGVQIRRYDIIYQITTDVKAALEGLLKPEKKEIDLGRAYVQQLFSVHRVGTIAGCRVIAGTIERNSRVRVIRDSRIIGDYALESLRREKDDAREVREGLECGMKLAGFNDLKEGDVLESYKVEEIARTL